MQYTVNFVTESNAFLLWLSDTHPDDHTWVRQTLEKLHSEGVPRLNDLPRTGWKTLEKKINRGIPAEEVKASISSLTELIQEWNQLPAPQKLNYSIATKEWPALGLPIIEETPPVIPIKRGPGRPRKDTTAPPKPPEPAPTTKDPSKRGPGRPRKDATKQPPGMRTILCKEMCTLLRTLADCPNLQPILLPILAAEQDRWLCPIKPN